MFPAKKADSEQLCNTNNMMSANGHKQQHFRVKTLTTQHATGAQ